ncbi:hypothetical protein ACFQ3W_12675 [Paenibacillus puldeungensis]|uniref:ABC transporter permease n=1 Tax=Paenibacillus puldeungensis TaxID=696536 RepID=A0ABW3RX96_9BACL
MNNVIDRSIRGLSFDVKLHKQPMMFIALVLFGLYLLNIVTGDPARPRTVYYLSEMGMFPLVIIVTLLMYQREIGGGGMEIIATYPISLRVMVVRKWVIAILISVLFSLGWMTAYLLKYGEIITTHFLWSGATPIKGKPIGVVPLLLQTLPAYLLFASLTVTGIIVFRKIYGGLILGFSVWVLDTISGGSVFNSWTLYTAYLGKEDSFPANRIVLLIASILLLMFSVWLVGKRERWIAVEEE